MGPFWTLTIKGIESPLDPPGRAKLCLHLDSSRAKHYISGLWDPVLDIYCFILLLLLFIWGIMIYNNSWHANSCTNFNNKVQKVLYSLCLTLPWIITFLCIPSPSCHRLAINYWIYGNLQTSFLLMQHCTITFYKCSLWTPLNINICRDYVKFSINSQILPFII